MSRRLRTTEVQRLLAEMEWRLAQLDGGGWVMLVDGKPLVVGGHSKDPDAAWGRARRGWAKGYKLHAVYDGGSIPVAWEITPLNEAEPETAARLVLSKKGAEAISSATSPTTAIRSTMRPWPWAANW